MAHPNLENSVHHSVHLRRSKLHLVGLVQLLALFLGLLHVISLGDTLMLRRQELVHLHCAPQVIFCDILRRCESEKSWFTFIEDSHGNGPICHKLWLFKSIKCDHAPQGIHICLDGSVLQIDHSSVGPAASCPRSDENYSLFNESLLLVAVIVVNSMGKTAHCIHQVARIWQEFLYVPVPPSHLSCV